MQYRRRVNRWWCELLAVALCGAISAASAAEPSTCDKSKAVIDKLRGVSKTSLLPSICTELYTQVCRQVVDALSKLKLPAGKTGDAGAYWLFEGCHKLIQKADGTTSSSWVKPCPSHVLGASIKDAAGKTFCGATATYSYPQAPTTSTTSK